jgi:hypothetical protein
MSLDTINTNRSLYCVHVFSLVAYRLNVCIGCALYVIFRIRDSTTDLFNANKCGVIFMDPCMVDDSAEIPTKMQLCNRIYYSKIY